MVTVMPVPFSPVCFFFLKVRSVHQHEPGQLPGWWRGNDFPVETVLLQQRDSPAVIQVGMGQQQVVDAFRLEAKRFGIFLFILPPALEKAAVDESPDAIAFDQVARSGNAASRAVKRDFHVGPIASVM
jgi:hypothetical protein